MNILLVDDNENYRRLMKDILYSNGYNVAVAMNGAEACEILSDSEPDLIISAIKMPVLDGIKLHAYVREMEEYKDIKFIFVSCIKEMYSALLRLDPTKDFVFDKTAHANEIVSKVNDLLFGKFLSDSVA